MKGLLIKDLLTIQKQTKFYIIMMIIFLLVPGMEWYSIFLGSMLPITIFSYDERSKWDNMARMLPYSCRDIVSSKYLFGYLIIGVSVVSGIVIRGAYRILNLVSSETMLNLQGYLLLACVALIVMGVDLPIMFWTGVEKMRVFITFFTIVIIMMVGGTVSNVFVIGETAFKLSPAVMLAFVGITLFLQVVSVKIAEILYEGHMK